MNVVLAFSIIIALLSALILRVDFVLHMKKRACLSDRQSNIVSIVGAISMVLFILEFCFKLINFNI